MPRIHPIVVHPDLGRSRVTSAWVSVLQAEGHHPHVLLPDQELDLSVEQSLCEQAELLLFVHPLHWYGAPWMLKRWIDQVLTFGWAYGDEAAIRGKPWVHAISVGAEEPEYRRDGSRYYSVLEFLTPYERTAAFCGARYQEPFLNYGGGVLDEEGLQASCERFRVWLAQLAS